jgi:galactonate dehydratase
MPLEVNTVSVQGNRLRITTRDGLLGIGPLGANPPPAKDLQELPSKLSGYPAHAWAALQLPESVGGAVNIALLDIVGKHARAPVFQVLGGPTRFKVRVMTRLPAGEAEASQAIRGLWDRGHRAFIVDVGEPRTIAARLDGLRKQLPGGAGDFVLDGKGKLSTGQAGTVAAELEKFHLLWFNEPCPSWNLAAETVVPLGFGNIEFQEFLKEDSLDVARPSLQTLGIGGCRKVAALAEVYYVAVAPQAATNALETMAAIHLAASIPNFFIQEIPADTQLTVRDGYLDVPNNPGLGVDP